jgi:hypothetical protein
MTNRPTKKPTITTAEELAEELEILSIRMHVVSSNIRYFGGMAAEPQKRARELSMAADMVYEWSREVKKEGKK